MFSRLTASPTLTLSARLLLRLIGSAILLILVCGAGVLQLTHADQRIQDVVGGTLSPVADLGRIQNDYNEIMQALVHATLTQLPSAVDDAVTIIKDNRLDIQRHWSPLSHSGLARQQQQLLQLTVRHRADADAAVDETLQLLNAGQFNIAQLKLSNDVQSAFVPLKSDFSNLFSLALAQGQTQAAVQHADNRRGLIGLLILLGVALAVAAWIDLAIIRSLGRRLRRASAVASRIAKGVLGDHVDLGHADEIGVLLQALARMDAQLESVVAQVRERASTVEHSAIGIAQGNEALNRRTQAQATLLESAALAMTRMAAAVAQGVQHANQADAAATDAHTQAAQGSKVASEAIGSMKEIERTSRQMSDVLDLVDQVAFQTHLLALNAAVEAARAGSHGRGFAVVAAEVRELAQRCGQASKDIRQLITESDEAVRAGTVLVSRTGSMLESIASSINRLSRLVGSMSTTGRGHASDIGTINHVVMDIDTMTQENAALVEEAAAASHAMQQSAGTLLLEVDFFTLKSDRKSEHIERQGDAGDVDDDEKLPDSREPVEAISA